MAHEHDSIPQAHDSTLIDLQDQLAQATDWHTQESQIWRTSLSIARRERLTRRLTTGGGIAACVVLTAGIITAGLNSSRTASAPVSANQFALPSERVPDDSQAEVHRQSVLPPAASSSTTDLALEFPPETSSSPMNRPGSEFALSAQPAKESFEEPGRGSGINQARMIVYVDTLHIDVEVLAEALKDTRALIDSASGEYVASSEYQVLNWRSTATLRLLVRPDRRETVIEHLGVIGNLTKHVSETSDATDQLIDLGARLNNERRIEQELLELLDQRDDAPLVDILEMRTQIARVRERIERLDAQITAVRSSVTLSTIEVHLRSPNQRIGESQDRSFLNTVGKEIGDAWEAGIGALLTSVSLLIQLFIGGFVFWVGIGLGVLAIVRWQKQAKYPPDKH